MRRLVLALATLLGVSLGSAALPAAPASAAYSGCAITIYPPTFSGGYAHATGYWSCTYSGQYYVEVDLYRWNGPNVYWQYVGSRISYTYQLYGSLTAYAGPCIVSAGNSYAAKIYIYRYANGGWNQYMSSSSYAFMRCG